ncbi:general secretion pathway protein H [Loktanella atrilutea]|uniref:General secretion pathway protein H n=1 Tax=Loktanella atrilutea TaxID=366533 RepID=A0A1M5FZE3_LOKAT|nr:prepilin-type N-terminal cleavage/methylation domain-containing protein [Loktanella atrilutea]SHF96947.1 general secretion pathway protein H [Loktanella atrilutea]
MRARDAGVTLVEVLVVLVLIGVMAGAVGLSLGPVDRGDALQREATLLAARLNRAADETLLTGDVVAFVWDADGYRFEVQRGADWQPHPVALLAEPHATPGARPTDPDGAAEGRFVVDGDLLPVTGAPLALTLRADSGLETLIRFDGVNAVQVDTP